MRLFRSAVLGSVALLAAACVYDDDDRCGDNQVLEDHVCVCEAGYGFDTASNACKACGANEGVVARACQCQEGFARDAAGACVVSSPGFGEPCATDADCAHQENPTCEPTRLYCTTQGCADASTCPAGAACNTATSPSFCERPPTGLGQSCAGDADCASFEATWCAIVAPQVCAVKDCSLDNDECFGDLICCDMSLYAAMGVPATLCVPPDRCAQ